MLTADTMTGLLEGLVNKKFASTFGQIWFMIDTSSLSSIAVTSREIEIQIPEQVAFSLQ